MTSWLLQGNTVYAQETPQPSQEENSTEDALQKKLLGPVEEVPASEPIPDVQMGNLYKWMFPFAALLVALYFLSRWKKSSPISPGEIRITSKLPLGREGSLAIIEVGTNQGTNKRILIGLHDNSAPRFIDKLDSDVENFDSFLSRVENEQTSPQTSETMVREEPDLRKEPVLQDRKDLLSEIYQARGLEDGSSRGIERYRQAANESSSNSDYATPVEVQEDEDPWAAKFRLIYNEKTRDD